MYESSLNITQSRKQVAVKIQYSIQLQYRHLDGGRFRDQSSTNFQSVHIFSSCFSMNTWKYSAAKDKKIETLIETGYQIIQINGQRIYSPSTSSGILPPPKGTEVFIGNLPPDLYEDEIIPVFSRIGAIYNCRLMMDFFGRNRGYAFVAYFRPEDAYAAVKNLHNYKIRNRTKIAVSISVDNRRLFVGNIPRTLTLRDIWQILERYVEGVTDVILYPEPYCDRFNRGFVFVEFQTHRLAAIARRQLCPGNLVIQGQAIFVDWAEPLPLVSPEIMKQVTKLYLSNIPPQLTTEQLKFVLHKLLGSCQVVKVHKIHDYAFVHFTTRKSAEQGYIKLQELVIMNRVIGVEWARPIEYSKNHRTGRLPDNFCKSVPPSMRRLVMQRLDEKNPKNNRNSSVTDESSVTTDLIEKFQDFDLQFF